MGTGGVGVGTRDTRGTGLETRTDGLHDLLHISHLDFRESDDVDLLLVVFSAVHQLAIVQKVVKLPAVDLVKADPKAQVWITL